MTEPRRRRRYSAEFKRDAVRLVLEQQPPIARVARDLDIAERVSSIDRRNPLCPNTAFGGGSYGENGKAGAVG